MDANFNGGAIDENNLAIQNATLRAEIAKLNAIKDQLPDKSSSYIRAIVYSRYPLNFKNELLLDAGENEGVVTGAAVTFGNILIGKIKSVQRDTSVVQTVFDSGFQSPVRIGSSGAEALLRGGSLPTATLITLKSEIAQGDIIYSASPDFPYDLPIGEVESVNISADKLFQEAAIKFVYDISGVQTVLVNKIR